MLFPLMAGVLLVWISGERIRRVEEISQLAGRANATDKLDANSLTGYANGQRELIVPERNERSFEWIAETQQMLARGEWQLRHVDHENAPTGREVSASSPYRWWLGAVAWVHHIISGQPIGYSVERAAVLSGPILHGMLLLFTAVIVAWKFGPFATSLASIGVVAIFPLGAAFLPGVPESRALAGAMGVGSVLVLLIGIRGGGGNLRWFALAGVGQGVGAWIDLAIQFPLIVGVFIGALLSRGIVRRDGSVASNEHRWSLGWRFWSLSGAATMLIAYLIEYFPSHLGGWKLESLHPLYGFAWLGLGEILMLVGREKGRAGAWRARDSVVVVFALLALAAVPIAMKLTGTRGLLALDMTAVRLTHEPNGIVSRTLWSWLAQDGPKTAMWATVIPLLGLLPVSWMMLRRGTPVNTKMGIAVTFGPVLIALAFATQRLSWWVILDAALLAAIVACMAVDATAKNRRIRWLSAAIMGLSAGFGVFQLLPPRTTSEALTLTSYEAEELTERHLAHWLAKRSGVSGAVVYAPPHQTSTLSFHGGFRGLGTFSPDNRAGFGISLNIAGASTMEEVESLIRARDVRYVVVPSWDRYFDEFAHVYLVKQFSNRTSLFISELRRWNLPAWLRPIAYHLPEIAGFEHASVSVFEVVDEQSPSLAASRLAEYFVEMGDLERAVVVGETLRRYPGDVSSFVARAQIQAAQGDSGGAAQSLEVVLARLSSGAARFMPWDRRVRLAVELARGKKIHESTEQTRRCLAEANSDRVRSLSTESLYGLMVVSRSFGLTFADPTLNVLALDLLPDQLRQNL
jgi:hypothetical protein